MLFGEAKRYFVQRRISDRMNALGIAPFRTYFAYLRSDADGKWLIAADIENQNTRPTQRPP